MPNPVTISWGDRMSGVLGLALMAAPFVILGVFCAAILFRVVAA